MKLLLDESIDVRLRHDLIGHDVSTVAHLKWKGLKNGELLRRAADEGFEALVTADAAMEQQHDVRTLPLVVIILRCWSNRIADLRTTVPELRALLDRIGPGLKFYQLRQP